MSESSLDVNYIAKLAKLELSPEETENFSRDLAQILEHVDQLSQWDIEGVAPMTHPLPDTDVVRADVVGESLSQQQAMENAPASLDGQVRVPKVVESAH